MKLSKFKSIKNNDKIFLILFIILREELLKKYINKEKIGLEIGPLFWGLCRKDEGFNVLIWDIMPKEELLDKYKKESKKEKKGIEEIDIVSFVKKPIENFVFKKQVNDNRIPLTYFENKKLFSNKNIFINNRNTSFKENNKNRPKNFICCY